MGTRVEDIKLVHRIVGTKHVFTSRDVPELHISHADRDTAFNSVQPALDLLDDMKRRLAARATVFRRKRERAIA